MRPLAARALSLLRFAAAADDAVRAQEVIGRRGVHRRRLDLRLSDHLALGARPISTGLRAAATSRSAAPGSTIRRPRRCSTTSRSARSPARCASRTARRRFRRVRRAAAVGGTAEARARPVSDRDRRRGRRRSISTASRPGALKLTGPLLADIFLGKVQTWSDPAIKALNPGPQAAGCQDRRRAPLRRLRHDLQLHQLSLEGQPAMAREGRLRPAAEVAGRHRRQGQRGRIATRCGATRTRSAMSNTRRRAKPGSASPRSRTGPGTFVMPSPESFQAAAAERRLGTGQRLRSDADRCARRERLSDRRDRVRPDAQVDPAAPGAGGAQFLQVVAGQGRSRTPPRSATCRCRRRWSRRSKATGQPNSRLGSKPPRGGKAGVTAAYAAAPVRACFANRAARRSRSPPARSASAAGPTVRATRRPARRPPAARRPDRCATTRYGCRP